MDKKTVATATIVTLLVLGTLYNFIPEPDDTHVCIADGEVVKSEWCDHLSGGKRTRCYQTNSSASNWIVCSAGWKAIDRSDIEPGPSPSPYEPGKGDWLCGSKGCVPILR